MALKVRMKTPELSIEEMFSTVNSEFIKNGKSNGDIRHFVISPTTGFEDEKAYLVGDHRGDSDEIDHQLQCYYGATIKEAVTNCFNDRHSHNITS